MCTILNFSPAAGGEARAKSCGDQHNTGEVVIFPGVRYEPSTAAQLREHGARQVKRDVLVL